MLITASAITFSVLTGIVVIFQVLLAAGVPWGAASMGGKYPGKYPPKMRFVAVVNALVLSFLAIIVLSAAGMYFPALESFSGIAVWFVVVFFALGTVMNIITPSKIERIWAPAAFLQFVSALIVALN